MNATVLRKRTHSVLIVGVKGRNVLRVVTAFEEKRIVTSRADDIASACECLVRDMSPVVLTLVVPANEAEAKRFADVASAVGALVVPLDPQSDETTFQRVLEHAVQATLDRRRSREEAETRATTESWNTPPPEDVDEGWDR